MIELDEEKMRVSQYGSRYQACKAAVSKSRELKAQVEKDLEGKIKAVSKSPV